jgi:hypothetical protein
MQADSTQSPESADRKGPRYRPLFSFDADVVLGSHDGVLFRVPSTTLKMTSAWFRTMFTLPTLLTVTVPSEIPLPIPPPPGLQPPPPPPTQK